jgi:hypothetical protein
MTPGGACSGWPVLCAGSTPISLAQRAGQSGHVVVEPHPGD